MLVEGEPGVEAPAAGTVQATSGWSWPMGCRSWATSSHKGCQWSQSEVEHRQNSQSKAGCQGVTTFLLLVLITVAAPLLRCGYWNNGEPLAARVVLGGWPAAGKAMNAQAGKVDLLARVSSSRKKSVWPSRNVGKGWPRLKCNSMGSTFR